MKIFGFLAVFALASTLALADDAKTNAPAAKEPVKISADDAKQHIGDEAIVTGTIAEVNKAERLVRLNFNQPFPKQPFTAVVFAANTNKFGDLDSLKGKQVEVKGKIAAYRDHPQIVLNTTNQLKLAGSESAVEKKKGKE